MHRTRRLDRRRLAGTARHRRTPVRGEDGKVRVTFRAEPGEVEAFAHLGGPYFKADWGTDVVGLVLDEHTDWDELAELLTDSYCVQAPRGLAAQVDRPGPPPGTPPDGSLAS
nr:hypothetical protein GCM10025730_04540 [Promicromonospora thailandica]